MKYLFLVIFTEFLIAEANDPSCGTITMKEWAGTTTQREELLSRPVGIVVIQHTASKECSTDDECVKVVRSIQKYQKTSMKFVDIAQSFLIGGNGKVYEGAGWTHIGAHTFRYNNRSVAISFIGDFRNALPTPQALKAAQQLIACGVENHHLSDGYHLVGHNQLSKTASPGTSLQKVIQKWPHYLDDVSQL